jgi:mono/diheme cytochrome c family protein
MQLNLARSLSILLGLGLLACEPSVPVDETARPADKAAAIETAQAQLVAYKKNEDGTYKVPIDQAIELVAKEGVKPPVAVKKAGPSAGAVAAAKAKLAEWAASPLPPFAADAALVEKGKGLFTTKTCSACHKTTGDKLVGPGLGGYYGGGRLTTKGEAVRGDKAYFVESVKSPNAKVVEGFPPAMPPMPLTDEEVEALFHYVATLK